MRIVFAALLIAGLSAGLAHAQVSLGQKRNGNQPIDINSDTLEVLQDKQLAIFRGKVDAVQGDTRLRSDELYVYYRDRQKDPAQKPAAQKAAPAGAGPDASSITRIEAKGNVFVSTPEERGQGDFGIYDVDKKTVTLTGNVLLTNDRGTVRCARAVMYQDSGRSICEPAAGGRVRGVFLPNDSGSQPAKPAAKPEGAKP
jgi:lipopolysaccharide export system protein LptA